MANRAPIHTRAGFVSHQQALCEAFEKFADEARAAGNAFWADHFDRAAAEARDAWTASRFGMERRHWSRCDG